MSRHRFFLEGELPLSADGQPVLLPLSASDLHHAVGVLRVHAGEELDVVAPSGRVWRVAVSAASPNALTASVADAPADTTDESALPKVVLVFGVSKGSRNDDLIEGAVEVGVSEMIPVLSARSVVKLDADKRMDRGARWRRVALAAAKQSKRSSVPSVRDPEALAAVLPELRTCDLVLVAWEEAAEHGRSIREAVATASGISSDSRVALVVGPEGGLSSDEVALLEQSGGVVVTLGATILRVETAGVVATALVVYELGGLGNSR